MFSFCFHSAHLSFMCCMTSRAKGVAAGSVCDLPVMYLTQKILFSVNNNKSICVVTPEYDSNGQLLFRENLVPMIHGRNMLLLISTVNSGKTARRALDCIQYYGGKTQGIAAVFSAIPDLDGIPVLSLFTPADISGYETYPTGECRMCKAGQRIDALANSYGLSTFR